MPLDSRANATPVSLFPVYTDTPGRQLRKRVLLFFLIIVVLLWAAVWGYLRDEKASALSAARVETENLSRAVAEHMAGTVGLVERTLIRLKRDYEKDPVHFNAVERLMEIPLARGMLVHVSHVNAAGYLIASSAGPVTKPIYVGDRADTRAHMENDTDVMSISEPRTGRFTGRMTVQFSIRLNRPDHGYAGHIGIGINPDYWLGFFRALDLKGEGGIYVAGLDMIVRTGIVSHANANFAGHDISATGLGRAVAGTPAGYFEMSSTRGGAKYMFSYRRLDHYPLVIVVQKSRADILAAFYLHRNTLIPAALALSLVFLAMARMTLRRIDAQRRAEVALYERTVSLERTNRRFEQVIEAFPMAFITVTRDLRVMSWNPAAERIFGYTAQEAIGQPYPIVSADKREALEASLDLLWHSGEITQSLEARRLHKDGRGVDVGISGGVIRDEKGIAREAFVLVEDISARKRAERELRQSETRFRGILEASPDAKIIIDEHGRIVLTSPRVEAVFGYPSGELTGRTLDLLLPGQIQNALSCHLGQSSGDQGGGVRVSGESSGNSLVHATHRDGHEFPAEVKFSGYNGAEGPRVIASVRDISYRVRIEEQLRQSQKMEAVGQLTGGIAHDFNNLLTTILGNTELLEWDEGKFDEETRDLIAAIRNASERASLLTKQMLAFSRKQPLAPEIVDLNKLVNGTTRLLRRTLGESITINVEPGDDLWPVRVDANQFENVILNLSLNARDAMPGGGSLIIRTGNAVLDQDEAKGTAGLEPGEYVVVTVRDSGTGMTRDALERAFEPFFTTKPPGQGTGLGLSQVYGFVRQSGGDVSLHSPPGEGVTVKILLPRHCSVADTRAAPAVAAVNQATRGTGKVLVVEDENAVREFSAEALTRLGYEVLVAATPDVALALLEQEADIALLFTDVGLPGMNGRELARLARLRVPGLKVLFTSGYAMEAMTEDGVPDHDMRLLSKPFTIPVLADRLREVFQTA